MKKNVVAIAVLCTAAFLAGCSPAEVQPPPESIPDIPPGRSSQTADDAGGPALPAGRTPAVPK